MPGPVAQFSLLNRPDGSASYSNNGYSVVGAVNGPVEVQRRDELPEEAALEINIRPAIGVGSTKERHLERILHSTLKSIILTRDFPRTLIQVTLQVLAAPENLSTRSDSYLDLLPALLTASLLTLIDAALPLSTILTSTLVAYTVDGSITSSPSPKEIATARSRHVFAFSSAGELLVSESGGQFSLEEWQKAYEIAEEACSGPDGDMEVEGQETAQEKWLRKIVGEKIAKDQSWRVPT